MINILNKFTGRTLEEKLNILFTTLEQDPAYILGYDRFVKGMSYASVDVPTFMLFISSGNVLLIDRIHKRWTGGE